MHHSILARWIKNVSTGDRAAVLALYAPVAMLQPTFSGKICTVSEQIDAYFQGFLPKVLGDVVVEDYFERPVDNDLVLLVGTYAFPGIDGRARFSMLVDDDWIYHHHSSAQPEDS